MNWILIIIGLISGWIIKEISVRRQWSKTKFWCVLAGTVVIFSFALNNLGDSSSSYDESGYSYVVNQLKSPTTAELISCVNKSKFRSFLKDECNIKLPDGLEAEYYEIAAENSFGGHIKGEFVVFFWNGKPIHMEENGLRCFESLSNWNATKATLNYNAGLNLK